MSGLFPTDGVREVLFGLSELYQKHKKPNEFGQYVSPSGVELSPLIKRLSSELHSAAGVLRNPSPGEGLASLYLRIVATRFDRLEQWANGRQNGWADAAWRDQSDLQWLARQGPVTGTEVNGWAARGPSGVAKLLEQESTALDRLAEKATEWAAEFADAPNEPQGALVKRERLNVYAPWKTKRDEYVKSCGLLLLEAIDQCEVSQDRMTDIDFAEATLGSLPDGTRLLAELCGNPFGPDEVAGLVNTLEKTGDPKMAMLDWVRFHGTEGVAFAFAVGWNVREWHRETVLDSSLESVLEYRLPGLVRQLATKLLDSHLADYATTIPRGSNLSAASLIAFIENLPLPEGVQVRIPLDDFPGEETWSSLARYRAGRLAMQMTSEDGQLLFDPESESDLAAIEKLNSDAASKVWDVIVLDEIARGVGPLANAEFAERVVAAGDDSKTIEENTPALSENKQDILKGCTDAPRKAYLSFDYAELRNEKQLEDRTAYDWLKENGCDDSEGLADYELPAFPTWSRYVREVRNKLGEQKNQPRAGRSTGGSVVQVSDL